MNFCLPEFSQVCVFYKRHQTIYILPVLPSYHTSLHTDRAFSHHQRGWTLSN